MWPFKIEPTKEALQGIKTIQIGGFVFKIKKINPLADFPSGKIPQLFSSFISRRKVDHEKKVFTEAETRKIQDDVYAVVKAGLVEPKINPPKGLAVEDLFRYEEIGTKLYLEIIAHSLNRFRGLKGFFTLAKIRRGLLMPLQNGMVKNPLRSSLKKAS